MLSFLFGDSRSRTVAAIYLRGVGFCPYEITKTLSNTDLRFMAAEFVLQKDRR
jgi:hypothetical protein